MDLTIFCHCGLKLQPFVDLQIYLGIPDPALDSCPRTLGVESLDLSEIP